MSGTPETILAFDFGLRRIGVAVGQQITASASPIGVVQNGENGPDWVALGKLVRDWQPARIVVGLPVNADDTPSAITRRVQGFIGELARFGLPVETEDERYSSREAAALLKSGRSRGRRGRIGRDDIDSAAATLIAERWLSRN
jgi:putative Holliday junction resolvase